MNTNINELAKAIHENAVAHGWWEDERSFGEIIALCHSELSEALEEFRDGKPTVYFKCDAASGNVCIAEECIYYQDKGGSLCGHANPKPEGIAAELADCIIRILDYCAHAGIDIDEAIQIKHEYNKTRPYRHGGKRL